MAEGLIEDVRDRTGVTDELDPGTVATAESTGYETDIGTVNQETDTVAGQLDTLLNKNSPYITRARTSAKEFANKRGLLNSTMAASAGEAAAIDAGLPIAQQDASTYSQQRLVNQGEENVARRFDATAENEKSRTNAAALNAIESQRVGGEIQAELLTLQDTFNKDMAQLDADLRTGQIMPAEYEQKKALLEQEFEQQSELSTQTYEQTLGTMDFQQVHQRAMATLQNDFAEGMAQLAANLETGQIMPAELAAKQAILQQEQTDRLAAMTAQADISAQMMQLDVDLQTGQIMPAEHAQQKELLKQQFDQQSALAGEQFTFQKELSAQAYAQTLGTMEFEQQHQTALTTLQNDFAQQRQQLEADLQTGQLLPAQYAQQERILGIQQDNQLATMQTQADLNSEMAQVEADLQTGQILPAQAEIERGLIQERFAASMALQTAQNDMALVLQELKGDQATTIVDLEGQYKNLIQSSASAANLYRDVVQALTNTYANTTMTEEQKTATAARVGEMLESGLTIIGAVADVDLVSLLDFGA